MLRWYNVFVGGFYAADCFIGRGEAWLGKGGVKQALDDLKKALGIDPGNPDYR